MKYLIRALGVVLVVELVLVLSGLVPPHIAAVLIVVTETTAFILGGTVAIKLIKALRARLKQGERLFVALEQVFAGNIPPKLLFMLKHEIGIFASIGRLVMRKKDIPAGAAEIKYGSMLRIVMGVLVVVSVVEIVAVELLVPWDIVRIVILVLSVYGLLWMVGLFAATLVYPHYVSATDLVIRFFHYHTIVVPLVDVPAIGTGEKGATENKTVTIDQGVLSLNVLGSTNVNLAFAAPVTLTKDGEAVEGIDRIRFSADNARTAAETLRQKS